MDEHDQPAAQEREAFTRHHGRMCFSSMSLMELIDGAERSANPERNLEVVEGFSARFQVLPYDERAASHTGHLRAELAKSGTPIGVNLIVCRWRRLNCAEDAIVASG